MSAPEIDPELVAAEHRYLMGTFKRLPLEVVRGEGCRVFDAGGRHYLDLVAGIAVNLLGHAHPAVVEAVSQQASRLIHTSNLYYTRPQVELAQRLVELSFPSRVFFANSGAEANEVAIKIARKWGREKRGGAYQIVAALGSFHGRTLATLAATGQRRYQEPFDPMPQGFVHVPYGDLEAIRQATTEATAAVMLEPIMGEVGVVDPPPGYLAAVRRHCDEAGVLFILDEIQTGLARTGAWFCHQLQGVVPDVMTLAKGLGGGVPIGACLAAPKADVLEPGDHGSTFGGNPLATRAALAVLQVIEQEGLVYHAREVGEYLAAGLAELPGVLQVRGAGLMRALVFSTPAARGFQERCLERGLIVNAVDEVTVRLVPPLIVTAAEIDEALEIMRQAL